MEAPAHPERGGTWIPAHP